MRAKHQQSLTPSMPRARGTSTAAGMCKAGTVSPQEVGSSQRVLKHCQVVLVDVAEQDLCPPVDGPEQGSQPRGAALALPELPVQAQGVQQQALQSARAQPGHRRRWEAAVESRRDREGRAYPGKAEQRGREQQGTRAKILQEEMHPEEGRTRSLLLKTLPMVSTWDSSIRHRSRRIPNREASSMTKCLMGNGARNAEIPDYSLFLCSCQLKRGNRLWSLPSATQSRIKS